MTDDENDEISYSENSIITSIKYKIVEPMNTYSYIQIIVNVMWLVDDFVPENEDLYKKISMVTMVLDSCEELEELRDIHYSTTEALYKLSENDKLSRFKKTDSWCVIC